MRSAPTASSARYLAIVEGLPEAEQRDDRRAAARGVGLGPPRRGAARRGRARRAHALARARAAARRGAPRGRARDRASAPGPRAPRPRGPADPRRSRCTGRPRTAGRSRGGPMLHAARLAFAHPITGARVEVDEPAARRTSRACSKRPPQGKATSSDRSHPGGSRRRTPRAQGELEGAELERDDAREGELEGAEPPRLKEGGSEA